jgi:hypothetical protein
LAGTLDRVQPVILYPRFGRVLTLIVAALLAAAAAVIFSGSGFGPTLAALPALAALLVVTWAMFFNPRVEVGEGGVRLVNVVTDVWVPWGRIARIDTKYALTLVTEARSYSAWAAPAPGRHSVFRANREEGSYLPESTYLAGTVRPGDLTTSDSGVAAAIIRREWERRRDSGLLENADRVQVHLGWKRALTIALSVGLAAIFSF